MYIYKDFFDNLLASERQLTDSELYDSELGTMKLIGEAHNRKEAWNLLKNMTSSFNELLCEGCKNSMFSEECEKSCPQYKNYNGYNYGYVCEFLYNNFKENEEDIFLVLIGKHENCNNMIFVNCFPKDSKKKNSLSIPIVPTLDESNITPLNNFTLYFDNYKEDSIEYIGKKNINGKKYLYYTCLSDEPGTEWKESCHCVGDGWYGYMNIEEIKNKIFEKEIFNGYLEIEKSIKETGIKDYSRYLICPYSDKMFLTHVASNEYKAYCPVCEKYHGFQRRNKAMNGIENGKINNAWIESW